MYTITKEFTFDAAHKLMNLPEGHKCSNLHGHTYTVIVELKSTVLDENGFVVDYGDLKPIKEYIDRELDHSYLNEIVEFDILNSNSTAENIARLIYLEFKEQFPQLSAVTVKETPKTSARYEKP
jgi:6-pyruvoyltetrahydropterin/6-carboxytetrahydropterin synthase